MSDVTIKGFIIARLLDLAKEQMSAEDFAALEQEVGVEARTLRLSFFRDFPVEVQFAVQEKLAPYLFQSKYDAEAARKFGRLNFDTFRSSGIGRATLALVGKDPKRLLRASMRLVGTVVNGMTIDIEDRGEKEMSLRFRNIPYPPTEWVGVIEGAVEHAGGRPLVKIEVHSRSDVEYGVSWS